MVSENLAAAGPRITASTPVGRCLRVPVTAFVVIECPALGKRALGRVESLCNHSGTPCISLCYFYFEKGIFL